MAKIFSNEQNEAIVMSAINSLAGIDFDSREEFERGVLRRSLTIQQLLRDDGAIMRTLNSVRLRAHIDAVRFEESSQRYIVEFTVPGQDPEQIRTPRVDTPQGQILEPVVKRAAGHWAIIYKNNEPAPEGLKGKNIPSSGYRVCPWIDLID